MTTSDRVVYLIFKTALRSVIYRRKFSYAIFTKSGGLPDKTGNFSFCPAKTFSLSDKCPMNFDKESVILTTKMPSVLQILILSCKRFQSV